MTGYRDDSELQVLELLDAYRPGKGRVGYVDHAYRRSDFPPHLLPSRKNCYTILPSGIFTTGKSALLEHMQHQPILSILSLPLHNTSLSHHRLDLFINCWSIVFLPPSHKVPNNAEDDHSSSNDNTVIHVLVVGIRLRGPH